MKFNLLGKLKNTRLAPSNALLPLYEAIANALDAVEETERNDGLIRVTIHRQMAQMQLEDDRELDPIESFVVEDNGIGFNDGHFDSFQTSESIYKQDRGAKGIGRFLWLKAFTLVKVSSVYRSETGFFRRSFEFRRSEKGVENVKTVACEERSTGSTVSLQYYSKEYSEQCPRKTSTIAWRIIDHNLVSFLSPEACPRFELVDGDRTIVLNDMLAAALAEGNSRRVKLDVKGQLFDYVDVHLRSADDGTNRVQFCANRREVMAETVGKHIPDAARKFKEPEGHAFTYVAYVTGDYLDSIVNSDRTQLDFPPEGAMGSLNLPTRAELVKAAVATARDRLATYLAPVREEKLEQIRQFTETKAPQYRAVVKYGEHLIDEIPPGLSDEKLDAALHRADAVLVADLKEQGHKLFEGKPEGYQNSPEFRRDFEAVIAKITEVSKSKLVEHVVHRRLILDLFERSLQAGPDGTYSKEAVVHEIIFPMRATSDDLPFEHQNLWIIDEKLAYHKYLASDQSLFMTADDASVTEIAPDIVVFNETVFDNPIVFAEGADPLSSVVIIEFKRPMRKDYGEGIGRDPFEQVKEYVRRILEGGVTDKNGRLLDVPRGTPLFCYIIADLVKPLREKLHGHDFIEMPDHQGYFKFHHQYSAYFEVIAFSKLLNDAKKRNRVLFDRLQIPTR